MMKTLPVLDVLATGIDVGSERLHVSIGGDVPTVFGTMTCDVDRLVDALVCRGVRTVAMEATGVYWLYLYEALEAAGMAVLVVNGRHVKNVPGRKTDMADCQWIATLHAHGLLRSGFVPPEQIRCLRDYVRLRQDHVGLAASHIQHMQKALERMNIKFHDVISDLAGMSGLKVMRAIVDGERDVAVLLELCDARIRNAKGAQVRESLRGTWREEHLFALKQALKCWDFLRERIQECDGEIERVLKALGPSAQCDASADEMRPPPRRKKRGGSNTPQIEGLHAMLVDICGGADATEIPGLADQSLLQVISEVGTDLEKWPTAKHFTAWAGLAPGSAQSGKRCKSQPRQRNKTGQIFSAMARSLANSVDKGLGGFYRRLKARRGGLVANKALARKLATSFWNVMVHGTQYVEQGLRKYEQQVALGEQSLLRKLAKKLNVNIVPKEPITAQPCA
jgi:transposase